MRYAMRHAAAFALALAGCTGGSVPVDHEEHRFDDDVDVDLGTAPWRERRRMDLEQLDRSIRVATGDIGWERWQSTAGTWTVRERYFDTYADTLGVPDYINATTEDRAISLLFTKFLEDASRAVCRRLADREAGAGAPYDGEARGIFAPVDPSAASPGAADVDAALASLLLRFHGRSVAPESAELEPWRALVARVSEHADPPQRTWEAVCVALLTHPDFYTY